MPTAVFFRDHISPALIGQCLWVSRYGNLTLTGAEGGDFDFEAPWLVRTTPAGKISEYLVLWHRQFYVAVCLCELHRAASFAKNSRASSSDLSGGQRHSQRPVATLQSKTRAQGRPGCVL